MPNFDKLFLEAKKQSIEYKNRSLIRSDYISFSDQDRVLIRFEKTNSEWTQGIGLYLFGYMQIDQLSEVVKERTVFWENTAPKELSIRVWREKEKKRKPARLPGKGLLGVKNIWDPGTGVIDSWHGGAAMIVEEIENGKRYRCNDGHPDENFDDIVFTIQKI